MFDYIIPKIFILAQSSLRDNLVSYNIIFLKVSNMIFKEYSFPFNNAYGKWDYLKFNQNIISWYSKDFVREQFNESNIIYYYIGIE